MNNDVVIKAKLRGLPKGRVMVKESELSNQTNDLKTTQVYAKIVDEAKRKVADRLRLEM